MAIRTSLAAVAPDGDEAVAARAIQLARAHRARLLLLRVLEQQPPAGETPFPIDAATIDRELRRAAGESLQRLAATADVPAELLLETGKAHAVIARLAADRNADLLLIGPGRPRNLRQRMFGSTADRLIRAAPAPLLLVKRPAAGPCAADPYTDIVVGVDFSAESKRAARAAAMVAPGAGLTLLHVVEIPLSFEQALLESGAGSAAIARYRRSLQQQARRRLRLQFEAEFPDAILRVPCGDAAELLVRASRMQGELLMAIGAEGADRMAERLLGSTARRLLLRSRADVLLIPG